MRCYRVRCMRLRAWQLGFSKTKIHFHGLLGLLIGRLKRTRLTRRSRAEARSPSRACPFDCRYTILDSAPVRFSSGNGQRVTCRRPKAEARGPFQVNFIIAKGFSAMTYLDMVFPYGANPGENELRAIDGMREVYGVLQVFFNEKDRTVRVKFDASRLKRDAVARLLRQAGIDVGEPLALA
jgi:hypothetical protein